MKVKLAQFKSVHSELVHYTTEKHGPYLTPDMVQTSEFVEVDFPMLPPNPQPRRDALAKTEADLRRQLANIEAERAKLDQPESV